MSIFSRLFNKNGDGDEKDPADEEASPDVKQEGNSRKPPAPATAATDGKAGTMRPAAPSFDITSTPAGAPSPSTEVAAPAARPDGRPPRANVSARTLPYVTPDVAAAVDARVQAARSKAAAPTTRQGAHDPAAPPARPRGAVPSPAAGAPARTHVSKDVPKPPPLPPEPSKHHDVGKRKEGPPDLPKGGSHARPRQPTGGAVAAAAPLQAEPVAADPTSDFLTLEFASSPRQKAALPVPAARGESPPSFDASASAVVPASNVDPSGRTPGGVRIEVPSEPTDSDGIGLLHDLDAAFGAMVGRRLSDRPIEAPSPHLSSVAEVRELFMALAANHMRQVRDFMIGLKWGEAPREALVLCEAATQSLLRAAKEMELGDLCAGLEGYARTLRQMSSAEEGSTTHQELMASYAKLAEQLPDVFALEGEQVQREAIIVHSLLQQVPEVRKVTIDKIYAAGLTGLDVLFDARPDEIAATTGISESLAALIVEKFRRYREDAKKLADVRHEAERRRLAELLTLLREMHGQYEVNASGWSEEAQARKKELRQARNEVFLQIKVLLARLGEVGRLNELERLPFERKIDELEKFLRDSKVQPAHALV